eukprot:TRINITY_DN37605_c0_g1_i1.p1 TRINITY_DN37605_c0_g1~~TRINITY_DN37605_c0_g1_i1.p1  ORF type:complete len:607 (-),score=44.36 TRINITY_DN37605_c0_g1_i1:164-1834(-)
MVWVTHPQEPVCTLHAPQICNDGRATLEAGESCDPRCGPGFTPIGPYVCRYGAVGTVTGGCLANSQFPTVPVSDVDALPDATSMSDMVFTNFTLVDESNCLIWPMLPAEVKSFILRQAGNYGPSAAALRKATHLGTYAQTEFFLSIEQLSILLAHLLCGATEVAQAADLPAGGDTHPQPFAFGRAMEHWFFAEDGSLRDVAWRRTTLVGYGTFASDTSMPDESSTVSTNTNLTIWSGCGAGAVADSGLADSDTLTVIFAGHYVGGWLEGWDRDNRYGAQEEKFGTLVPEMMLATEPLRHMGAGLLSNGGMDPWLPAAGWYILGAGSYVKGKGYPRWGSEKVVLRDSDYFKVGTGRRIRRRGLVGILGKPCNDRPGCDSNTNDHQYRCYNQQVDDSDLKPAPEGANLWGIVGGAFELSKWPRLTRELLEAEGVTKRWLIQGGGWGAGAFGCGTLFGGLAQLLAAKRGGWEQMRMCWAGRGDPTPTLDAKLGYAFDSASDLAQSGIMNGAERGPPLLTGVDVTSFQHGRAYFQDSQFGRVAAQLHRRIDQNISALVVA